MTGTGPGAQAGAACSWSTRPEAGNTSRGEDRKQAIVEAAAALIREAGPSAVSHRSVARRAGCSLSATTYYFDGLDDLLHQAGLLNIGLWASRAERVADYVEALGEVPGSERRIELLLQATLPSHGRYLGHYLQLIGAGKVEPVEQAYRQGRQRLNTAVGRVLQHLGSPMEPEMVIAVVDGAAVTALSEGRDVKATATTLLSQLTTWAQPGPATRSATPGPTTGRSGPARHEQGPHDDELTSPEDGGAASQRARTPWRQGNG